MDHISKHPKPSTPSDARMRKTRAALYEALLALLEEKPFDNITIREIAARAHVGYATFFRHYQAKGGLLYDLVADQISELINQALPAFTTTDTDAAAFALCSYVDGHRRLWSALLTGGAAGIVREEFVRQARQMATPSRRHPWLPSELGVIYGVSATVEILAWWLQQGSDVTVPQIAGILNRLVIMPLVVPSAVTSEIHTPHISKAVRARKL
ncbi:MAG: TetR/AcrR family transcriptional regulator [Rhodospirillaceae bacterium]|nr:MAG: TetR/AcrR family transcriptional regulator [Rhodospirillaceae bacterium]